MSSCYVQPQARPPGLHFCHSLLKQNTYSCPASARKDSPSQEGSVSRLCVFYSLFICITFILFSLFRQASIPFALHLVLNTSITKCIIHAMCHHKVIQAKCCRSLPAGNSIKQKMWDGVSWEQSRENSSIFLTKQEYQTC